MTELHEFKTELISTMERERHVIPLDLNRISKANRELTELLETMNDLPPYKPLVK